MKPAGIRYVTLLGIFLLATAVAWTSLLEARGPNVPASRMMSSARLFEQQGRVLKAAELYRQVLRANPGNREAAYRLSRIRASAAAVLSSTEPEKATPVSAALPVQPVQAVQAKQPPKLAETVKVVEPAKSTDAAPKRKGKSLGKTLSNALERLKPRKRSNPVAVTDSAAEKTSIPTEQRKPVELETAKQDPNAEGVATLKSKEPTQLPVVISAKKTETNAVSTPESPAPPPETPKKKRKNLVARLSASVAKLKPRKSIRDNVAPKEQEPTSQQQPAKKTGSKTKQALTQAGESLRTLVARKPGSPTTPPVVRVVPTKPQLPGSLGGDVVAAPSEQKQAQPTASTTSQAAVTTKTNNQERGGETEIATTSETGDEPKPSIPKTRIALEKLKGKLNGILPKRDARVATAKTSPPAVTPVEAIDRVDEDEPVAVATGTAAVTPRESVGTRLGKKTKAAFSSLRGRFETRSKTTATTKKKRATRTPLWERVNSALRRSRDNVAGRFRGTSKADTVAVSVPETTAATKTQVKPAVVTSDDSDTVKPQPKPTARPAEIPEISTSERIVGASKALQEDAMDEAARKVLVEAVAYAPDVEASLAAYLLGTRVSGHQDVMLALGRQLTARKGAARVHMGEAMLRLDGNHVAATDSLIGMMSSKQPEIRMMAAFAMQAATAGQRDRCISKLITTLRDEDSDVRAVAALSLGGYGPAAKVAVPKLIRLIHDEDVDTARAAGVALQCIATRPVAVRASKTEIKPVAAEAVKRQ